MRPLRDTREFASASERRIAELLATLAPYEPGPARKPQLAARLGQHRQRSLRLLKPVAGLALLFAGTAAAATFGEQLWSEPTEQAPPQIPVTRVTPPHHPRSTPASIPRSSEREPEPERMPETGAPAREPKVLVAETSASEVAPRTARPSKKATRTGEDPRPVVEALRALRNEQDPARAQALLNDYLQSNPQGALSEEALALSIEAAHARKDPAAKSHARRYLARYPRGRHRRLAERALAE